MSTEDLKLSDYNNIGTMNGWLEIPKELKECREKEHVIRVYRSRPTDSYAVYFCPTCVIRYDVYSD